MIKKTSSITITSITRVILIIIETIFISTTKSKQKATFKKSMCYNYNKIDYYKKDYIIQDQIETNKFFFKKSSITLF